MRRVLGRGSGGGLRLASRSVTARRLSQAIAEGMGSRCSSRCGTRTPPERPRRGGAEGLVVRAATDELRGHAALPLLAYGPSPDERLANAADAVVLDGRGRRGARARSPSSAASSASRCVVRVRDDDELERALEQVDPEILLLTAERAPTTSRSRSTGCSSSSRTCPPGSSRSPSSPTRRAATSRSSSARASTPCSSRATSPRSSATACPTSSPAPCGSRPGSTRGASRRGTRAVLALAAALRIVGAGSGLPLPLLNPDEASIVPRAWELAARAGLDPGWYDYPSLLFLLVAPTQIGLDEPSYGPARVVAVALGLLGVAAAWWLGRVARRHARRDRRRRRRRRRHDPRRVLADGRHRRPADARRHRVPRAARHRPPRVGRGRGRSRGVGEVPRGAARSSRSSSPAGARWRRVAVSAALALRGVRADQPVRPPARRPGVGRLPSRAVARTGRLARLRGRPGRRRSPTRAASGTRSARSPWWRWRGSASPSGGTGGAT